MSGRTGPGRVALVALCVLIGVWLIAPTVIVIPMSFTEARTFAFPPEGFTLDWYSNFFTDEAWYDALFTSLQIALLVTAIAVVLGTAAAFGLVRGNFRGKGMLQGVILTPQIVPVVVAGIGIFAVYLKWRLSGRISGFVLAHTALALPFVVITVSASLRTFDRHLERAAANLGASPWQTFRRVTLPIIRPGVISGALFAFISSFDEVVVSLFLQSPSTRTLPVQMFSSVTREIDPTIAAASSMIVVFTTAAILMIVYLQQRESHAR